MRILTLLILILICTNFSSRFYLNSAEKYQKFSHSLKKESLDDWIKKKKSITRPYIIYRPSQNGGFWSNFSCVLAGIAKADRHGWNPVVDMEQHHTLYSEEEPVFGMMNAWEYFFEQPGSISLFEAYKLDPLIAPHQQPLDCVTAIQPRKSKLKQARKLIRKYIQIKKPILADVNAMIRPGLHYKILGVHVRGTDRRKGAYRHLLTANDSVYLKKVIKLDNIHHFKRIFLACDEIETVKLFKEKFGQRLFFTKAYRISREENIRSVHTLLLTPPRVWHKYLLGKEVLIDALLLARCGHLLCGPSNVSQAAMYFALDKQIIHEVDSPGVYQE
jgi:hypothetical protein